MSIQTSRPIALATFFLAAILLYSPILLDWSNRSQKGNWAKEQLSVLHSGLPLPDGATALQEMEGVIPPNYFNDCFGARAKIIYGTNLPVSAIREFYSRTLSDAGWQLDLGYKQVEDYQVYKKNDTSSLMIDTTAGQKSLGGDFKAVYSVWLEFVTPYEGCQR